MALNVLFIDDESALCEIFQDIFSSPDLKITTFTDPKKALEACKTITFQVGFVDFRMPNINGDEFAKQLTQKFPLYLMTGEIDPNPSFSFSGILPKPFNYPKIEEIFANLLKK